MYRSVRILVGRARFRSAGSTDVNAIELKNRAEREVFSRLHQVLAPVVWEAGSAGYIAAVTAAWRTITDAATEWEARAVWPCKLMTRCPRADTTHTYMGCTRGVGSEVSSGKRRHKGRHQAPQVSGTEPDLHERDL
jgi:hypothetical protein